MHRQREEEKIFFSDTLLIRLEWHSPLCSVRCVLYVGRKWKLDFDAFFHARRSSATWCIVQKMNEVSMQHVEKGESSKKKFNAVQRSIRPSTSSSSRVNTWRTARRESEVVEQVNQRFSTQNHNFLPHSSPVFDFFAKKKKEIFRVSIFLQFTRSILPFVMHTRRCRALVREFHRIQSRFKLHKMQRKGCK